MEAKVVLTLDIPEDDPTFDANHMADTLNNAPEAVIEIGPFRFNASVASVDIR